MPVQILDNLVSGIDAPLLYTVTEGINRLTVGMIGIQNNTAQPDVTSVTLNGESATKLIDYTEPGENLVCEIWATYEVDVSSGVDLTGSFTRVNPGDTRFAILTLEYVEQVAPEDTFGANGEGGIASQTLSPISAGAMALDFLMKRNVNTATQGADQTRILDVGANGEGWHSSHQNGDDGGVMSWSWVDAVKWCHVGVSLTFKGALITPKGLPIFW